MPHIVSPELHDVVFQAGGLHGLYTTTDQIRIKLVRPLLQHVDIDVHGGQDPPHQLSKCFRSVGAGVFFEFIKFSKFRPLWILCCGLRLHDTGAVLVAGGQATVGEFQYWNFYAEILKIGRF